MRTRLALGALGLAMLTACGSAAASHDGLHGAHACRDVTGYTCSTLDVPLDHSGRTSGTLHLAVGAADNANAPRGVLLVLSGGPGQPGLPLLGRFVRDAIGAETRAYRVVVFDQRGTGDGALDCDELQRQMGSSDLTPPTAAAVQACARKLGTRRQFFGTDDVVADIESLRQALGVDKLTLDGVSYGTYVGERYALAHPGHVAKLVLDSVVPQTGEVDLVDELRGVRRVLRSVCGNTCVADLAKTVSRYHDGPKIFDALTFFSIADPTYRQLVDIPTALHDAARGNAGLLDELLIAAQQYQQTPAPALDQGLHASALCADWRYPWGDSSAPLASRAQKLAAYAAKLTPAELYPFDRATATGNGFIRQCLPWAPTAPTPLPHGKLRVPTLLVNGDHDLSTPLEWARKELVLTTNAKLVVVPGAGHSVQSRAASNAGRKAVASFLLGR